MTEGKPKAVPAEKARTPGQPMNTLLKEKSRAAGRARALLWYVLRHGGDAADAAELLKELEPVLGFTVTEEQIRSARIEKKRAGLGKLGQALEEALEEALSARSGRKTAADSIMRARMLARPHLERVHPASFWRHEPYTAALAYHWLKAGSSMEDVGRGLELFYEQPMPTNSIAGTIERMRGPGENKENPSDEWKEWESLGKPEGDKALWLLRRASDDAIIEHTGEEAAAILELVDKNKWESWFRRPELTGNKDARALVAELLERKLPAEVVASAVRASFDIELPWWVYSHMLRAEKDSGTGFITGKLRVRLTEDESAQAKTRADSVASIYAPVARGKSDLRPAAVVAAQLERLEAEKEALALLEDDPVFVRMIQHIEAGKSPNLGPYTISVGSMLTARSGDSYETGLGMMMTPLLIDADTEAGRASRAEQSAFLKKFLRTLKLAQEVTSLGAASAIAARLHALKLPIERIVVRRWDKRAYEILADVTLPIKKQPAGAGTNRGGKTT